MLSRLSFSPRVSISPLLSASRNIILTSLQGLHVIATARNTSVLDGFASVDGITSLQLDVTDPSSVSRCKADVAALTNGKLDILINNAGTLSPGYKKTSDGIEETFAVCHIAHWLLTSLLMPKLMAAVSVHGEARVVNLASTGHNFWDGDFEDYNFVKKPYNENVAYGQAKAANIVFSKALAQKFGSKGIKSYSVQPGCESPVANPLRG